MFLLVVTFTLSPVQAHAGFWGEEEEKLGKVSDIYGNCYELVGVRTYYFWIQSGDVEMRWNPIDC